MQMLKEKSKSQKNIIFTGWLSTHDVYAHYAISDIAVFPASQSILWQQAIASGLPLVVGNTGHQSIEYLNMYENIIMMKKDDIQTETIKNNIEKVLTDTVLYAKMHEGALMVRDKKLDWNQLHKNTLRFNNGENNGR
jgi:glycosyltransferase involved in cell wall biosynthesis